MTGRILTDHFLYFNDSPSNLTRSNKNRVYLAVFSCQLMQAAAFILFDYIIKNQTATKLRLRRAELALVSTAAAC